MRSSPMRETGKPHFLECRTYRFRAHSMFDAQLYRPKDEVEDWRSKGPIVRFQGWLEQNGLIHAEEVATITAEVDAEIAEAVAFAEAGSDEPVGDLDALRHVAEERPAPPRPPNTRQDGRNDLPRGRQGRDRRGDGAATTASS